MDSVDIVHGLSGHCPWTLTVDNFHGLSGHCPWKLSSQFLGFSQTFYIGQYRAMHSEGVLMFSLGICPSKLIDIIS